MGEREFFWEDLVTFDHERFSRNCAFKEEVAWLSQKNCLGYKNSNLVFVTHRKQYYWRNT